MATLTATDLNAGANTITAVYSGDDNFAVSTSDDFDQEVSMINLYPLEVEAEGEVGFSYNAGNQTYHAAGTILVGLQPPAGMPFKPLVSLQGTMSYSKSLITADGQVSVYDGSALVPLFNGMWQVQVGQAVTNLLNYPSPFPLGGLGLQLASVSFVSGGVELQGVVTLPTSLGGESIQITGNNYIGISSAGVTFTGVVVTDPNQYQFNLAGFQLDAENLWLSYDNTSLTVLMGGTFELPQLNNTTISLSQEAGQYLSIAPAPQVGFVGQIDVASIPIYGPWSLSNVIIDVNAVDEDWDVSGRAQITGPNSVSLAVTIDVNAAGLQGSSYRIR